MNRARFFAGVINTIAVFAFVSHAAASGGIVFVKSDGVWFMNTDGSGQRRLVAASNANEPRLANDVVVYISNGQLFRTNTSGASPQAIPNGGNVREVSLKPDGTRVAFTYDGGTNNFALNTMNVDGTGRVTINTAASLHQIYLYWGRDGYIYLGQSPYGNPYAQYVARIPENGVNNVQTLTDYFAQQPAEGGTEGKIAFLYNQPSPRFRLMSRTGSLQVDVPNSPSGINEVAFDYDANVLYYSIGDQIRRINTTGTGDALLASGTTGAFGYGTVPGSVPQDTSSLRVTGGTLAGQNVSSVNPSLTISPGASISGSFTVSITSTFPSNAVMSIGVTPSWGNPAASFADLGHFSTPTTNQTLTIPVSYVAPSTPGTYYIVAAFNGEFDAAHVLSCTNWTYGSAIWNDGNDVAAWSPSQITAAMSNGRAPGSLLFSDGMKPMNVPAAAITVTVQSSPQCNYSISPQNTTMPASGGSGIVSVSSSPSGCSGSWNYSSNASWISILSGGSGSSLSYSVAPNNSGSARTGTINVAGQVFTVFQQASPTCSATSTRACMLNGRFSATVRYRSGFDNNPADQSAFVKTVSGFASPNFETAFFYFSSDSNIEMMVKMLDQGNTNGQGQPTIAVLFGTATPLRIELTITDTLTSATKTYVSSFNSQQGSTDFTAFVK